MEAVLISNSDKCTHILLAEDNPNIREMVALFLERRYGWKVTPAEDGSEAVDHWMKGCFDLVLMDIRMPGVDGLEATELIRRMEAEIGKQVQVPIIGMSAQEEYGKRSIELGMNAFLRKPFMIEELALKIMSFIQTGSSGFTARERTGTYLHQP